MPVLRATLWRPIDLDESALSLWRRFQAAELPLQHPFLAPEFAQAVDMVSPGARVAVFEDGSRVVGFFAFSLDRFGIARPIGGRVGNRQAFIPAPGLPWSWSDVLEASGVNVATFSNLFGDQAETSFPLRCAPAPIIDTSGGWDEYAETIRHHKTVKSTWSRERKLQREVGGVDFTVGVAERTDIARLVAWKSEQYRRTGHPDPFANAWVQDLIEVLNDVTRGGMRPVFSALHADGRMIAADFSLTSDAVFAGWFAAHHAEFAQYSPGTIRTLRTIQFAYKDGVQRVDLSRGDEPYKQMLKTADVPIATGYVHTRSVSARLYRVQHEPRVAVEQFVLDHPRLRGAVRSALKGFGSARSALSRGRGGRAGTGTRPALAAPASRRPEK